KSGYWRCQTSRLSQASEQIPGYVPAVHVFFSPSNGPRSQSPSYISFAGWWMYALKNNLAPKSNSTGKSNIMPRQEHGLGFYSVERRCLLLGFKVMRKNKRRIKGLATAQGSQILVRLF